MHSSKKRSKTVLVDVVPFTVKRTKTTGTECSCSPKAYSNVSKGTDKVKMLSHNEESDMNDDDFFSLKSKSFSSSSSSSRSTSYFSITSTSRQIKSSKKSSSTHSYSGQRESISSSRTGNTTNNNNSGSRISLPIGNSCQNHNVSKNTVKDDTGRVETYLGYVFFFPSSLITDEDKILILRKAFNDVVSNVEFQINVRMVNYRNERVAVAVLVEWSKESRLFNSHQVLSDACSGFTIPFEVYRCNYKEYLSNSIEGMTESNVSNTLFDHRLICAKKLYPIRVKTIVAEIIKDNMMQFRRKFEQYLDKMYSILKSTLKSMDEEDKVKIRVSILPKCTHSFILIEDTSPSYITKKRISYWKNFISYFCMLVDKHIFLFDTSIFTSNWRTEYDVDLIEGEEKARKSTEDPERNNTLEHILKISLKYGTYVSFANNCESFKSSIHCSKHVLYTTSSLDDDQETCPTSLMIPNITIDSNKERCRNNGYSKTSDVKPFVLKQKCLFHSESKSLFSTTMCSKRDINFIIKMMEIERMASSTENNDYINSFTSSFPLAMITKLIDEIVKAERNVELPKILPLQDLTNYTTQHGIAQKSFCDDSEKNITTITTERSMVHHENINMSSNSKLLDIENVDSVVAEPDKSITIAESKDYSPSHEYINLFNLFFLRVTYAQPFDWECHIPFPVSPEEYYDSYVSTTDFSQRYHSIVNAIVDD